MYAFQMWGKASDATVRKGAKYIRKKVKFKYNTQHADLYAHYYYSLAMRHRGGRDGEFYKKMLGAQLIKNQSEDGSWLDVGGGRKVRAVGASYQGTSALSRHYRSCLCALILEAPYRYNWYAGAVKR